MDDVIYSRPLGGGARPGRETVLISSGRLLTDLYDCLSRRALLRCFN